jgi:hypothetical protein
LEKRRQLAQVAGRSKVSFRVGTAPVPPVVARFAPDDYDIIAGVRTAIIDQVLNGLHQTRTIPRVVPLETLLSENDRKLLATSLTGIFGNIPRDAVAGNIILRGPLSTAALDRTDALRLSVPFTLEIVRFVDSGGVRTRVVVSTLVATLGLVVSLGADVGPLGSPEAAALVLSVRLLPNPPQGPVTLVVDPASPVQATRPQDLPSLGLLLQNGLATVLSLEHEVSPFINIPSVPGVRLVVEHIDVRSVRSAAGDLFMAGVRFIGAGPTPGDPERLAHLPPDGTRNFVIRIHERYLDSVLETARATQALSRLASEQAEQTVVIKSGDATLGAGVLTLTLQGAVPNACATLDLDFTVTQTFRFFLQGDSLRVESATDISYSRTDQVLCGVLAFLVGFFAALPIVLASPFIGIFVVVLIAGGLLDFPGGSASTSVFQLDTPIPRTELLPRLDHFAARAEDGIMVISGIIAFRPDDINTFIYTRFLQRGPLRFDTPSPLKGAGIQVCDLDIAPPPGDDVVAPVEGETEKIVGNKFIRTVTTTYERPTKDPVLADAITDFDGRAMFALHPNQVSNTAGFVVTTTTIESLRTAMSRRPPAGGPSSSAPRTSSSRRPNSAIRPTRVGCQAGSPSTCATNTSGPPTRRSRSRYGCRPPCTRKARAASRSRRPATPADDGPSNRRAAGGGDWRVTVMAASAEFC